MSTRKKVDELYADVPAETTRPAQVGLGAPVKGLVSSAWGEVSMDAYGSAMPGISSAVAFAERICELHSGGSN